MENQEQKKTATKKAPAKKRYWARRLVIPGYKGNQPNEGLMTDEDYKQLKRVADGRTEWMQKYIADEDVIAINRAKALEQAKKRR